MNCPAIHECPYSAPFAINHGSHCVSHITKLDNQELSPSCDGTRLDFESNTHCAIADLVMPCPRPQCVDHNNGKEIFD